MWEVDGVLYFGTTDGKICRFYSDTSALGSYNDDGVAIESVWDTPDFDGELFYKNKTFRYLAGQAKNSTFHKHQNICAKKRCLGYTKRRNTTGKIFLV